MNQSQYKNLITDIKGLQVGQAECRDTLTGVTVIFCDMPFTASVNICGGGPGTRETDALAPHRLVDKIDAIVFSGGSVYGLAAADKLTALLGAKGRGYGLLKNTEIPKSPIIPSAVLYDLANGGNKHWDVEPPYRSLAEKAYSRLGKVFDLGCKGAGMGAVAGRLKGGVGSVSIQTQDGFYVSALSCVNSFGSVIRPGGAFWAKPYEQNNEYGGYNGSHTLNQGSDLNLEDWSEVKYTSNSRENTTLSLIATDADLTKTELKQISLAAANGLARAIRPVCTPFDGDVLFALSNGEKQIQQDRKIFIARIGALAADCVARSIARGVYEAESIKRHQSWKSLFGWQGEKS